MQSKGRAGFGVVGCLLLFVCFYFFYSLAVSDWQNHGLNSALSYHM